MVQIMVMFEPPAFMKVPEGESVRDGECKKELLNHPDGVQSILLTWPANNMSKIIALRTLECWFYCIDRGEKKLKIKLTFLINHYFKHAINVTNENEKTVHKEPFERSNNKKTMVTKGSKLNQIRTNVMRWCSNVATIKFNVMLTPNACRSRRGRVANLPQHVYFDCYNLGYNQNFYHS